ncbi:MAG: ABC transporter ATP-binding protein [Spirochaetota bacterium]
MKYLEIQGLGFSRPGFSLSADLVLEKGETAVILGPSGCGKTSLLRCIAGLEKAQTGSVWVDGRRLSGLAPEKRGIGFVFQDLALFDHLDGRENIAYGLRLRKIPKESRDEVVTRLAEKLRISSLLDRKPPTLSGGERQRLAFARAIAYGPSLLLLDEPLSSLDAPLRKELRSFLRSSLKERGITSIHVTHDVEEAFELADRMFLMREGAIVASGTPQEVFSSPPDAWCVRFLGLGSLVPILSRRGELCITDLGTFRIPASHAGRAARAAPAGSSAESSAGSSAGSSVGSPGPEYLFIPRTAVGIIPKPQGGSLEFEVEWEIFRGEGHRLGLRRKDLRLECDVPGTSLHPPGCTVGLSIDAGLCQVLS